jgi:hypothetical protein
VAAKIGGFANVFNLLNCRDKDFRGHICMGLLPFPGCEISYPAQSYSRSMPP